MSTSIPEPSATTVTDADPNKAIANATDDANNHTPEPPVSAPDPDEITDPTSADDKTDDLREMVTGLANQVTALTDLVTHIANPDESAGSKLPFLLRGKREL